MTKMYTYFRTETQDVAQNLFNDFFFLTLTLRKKSEKNVRVQSYFLKNWKPCILPFSHALIERAEAATSSYSAAVNF